MSQHIGMWSLQKKGEAQLDLGGIRKELQWPHRVTQRTLLLSIACWRNISDCQGSSPSSSVAGAPFQTAGTHFHPAPTAPRNVQLHLHQTHTGCYWRIQSQAFPCAPSNGNGNALLCRCTKPDHQLPPNLQNFRKANELSVQIKSQPDPCTALQWLLQSFGISLWKTWF